MLSFRHFDLRSAVSVTVPCCSLTEPKMFQHDPGSCNGGRKSSGQILKDSTEMNFVTKTNDVP